MKYKDYPIKYCELCDALIIRCATCTGTTCNANSCDLCSKDFDEFEIWLKTQDEKALIELIK
jgi:hypothetical protein